MPFDELERVYERLAKAIDEAGQEATPLFLAKLSLMLANHCHNSDFPLAAIETCLKDIR
jgi:hypothetical protein